MESLPRRTDRRTLLNKKRKINEVVLVGDHIGELSDDILVNILSRLSMREAVRTSILSSRWRNLWKGFTGCLDFDDPLTMQDLKWNLCLKSEPLDVERYKFVNWVNQVLRSLEGHRIEGLTICFDVVSNNDIDNWIKFASDGRVQRLELDFNRVHFSTRSVGQYIFSSHLDFYSLTCLSLTTVSVTGEVIEHLLSHCCPFLEVLSVTNSATLKSLKVSGSSLKLKHLKLEYAECLKDLELNAPNLLSFEYLGAVVPLSFQNVPNLVRMSLSFYYSPDEVAVSFRDAPNLVEVSFGNRLTKYILWNLWQHTSFLVQLHTLKLDMPFVNISGVNRLNNIPELCNLKHLEVVGRPDVDFVLVCIAFLKASPSLYKFALKPLYSWDKCESIKTIKDHPYLGSAELKFRVVEMLGFEGHVAEIDFLNYLIESAKLLEKIIIDPCLASAVGSPLELTCREGEAYQLARRRAIELAAKFPLWEFVIP